MMLDIESIKIVEELGHPFIHDLMVGPSELKFVEEDCSALGYLGAKGGEDCCGEVVLNSCTVTLVEFARVVVGRALGTHVVTSALGIEALGWVGSKQGPKQ